MSGRGKKLEPTGPLPDPAVKPWMTVDEALPWLPCGRNVAYAAVRSGEIPSIRIGRSVAIPTSWLWTVTGLQPPAFC